MNNIRKLLIILIIYIPSISFSEVKDGIFNISGINISEKNVKLDGEWEFFWKEFISPGDNSKNSTLIEIPGSWTNNTNYSSWGYGSFRINLKGLQDDEIYSLYIPDMSSNYKLFINGELLSSNGVLGKTSAESIPQSLPKAVTFEQHGINTEIIIHVSNFDYRLGGIWYSILLGSDQNIRKYVFKSLFLDIFVIGILLSVSLLHIGIYLFRRKEIKEFLFGIICFSLFFRIISTNQQILTLVFPEISWELVRRFEFMPFYFSVPVFILLTNKLFPTEMSQIINKIILIISILQGIFFIFLPISISNNIIPLAQMVLVLTFIYIFVIMVKSLKNRRVFSILYAISYGTFFLAVIHDILYTRNIIQTTYLTPIGFIISIIGQSQILTKQFIMSLSQTEILTDSRDKFRQDSITDGLTKLFNSRYLYSSLEILIDRAGITNDPLSILMTDIDDFKIYNDTYGHLQGDNVLKKISNIFNKSAREGDIACRYGGEEFTVVLPNTQIKSAMEVAERIRLNFEHSNPDDKNIKKVTISIGVTQLHKQDTVKSVLERADKALYLAKKNGKNRVEVI